MSLSGRTNRELGNIYHLSESSIRRILSKERAGYQKMKKTLEQVLSLWGMEGRQLSQIYPSAWEVNHSYVIKIYHDKNQLERNIKISSILSKAEIPVAHIVPAKSGDSYVEYEDIYFLMSEKLPGSNISDNKDEKRAWEMGRAISHLHRAFIQCEKEMEFWDNSLLQELEGWIRQNLEKSNWQIIHKTDYIQVVENLKKVYSSLPKQLIHRDVHFGNFLFTEDTFSGYIDFDLSQRNIRIFDLCYFLAGLLAEETEAPFTKKEWLCIVKAVITGYDSISLLTKEEKDIIPCVMESIEILFAAYFMGIKDRKCAEDAGRIFHFIRDCERDIKNIM